MGLGWLLTARSVLASLSPIRPSSRKRLSIRAPMGYPHRRPVIKTKLPGWDSPIKRDKKGKRGFVSRGTPFRATIMPEQIIKGKRVGRTTSAQRRSPFLAPVRARAGQARRRMRQKTAPKPPRECFMKNLRGWEFCISIWKKYSNITNMEKH